MKQKYERLIEALKVYSQEEIAEKNEDDRLIEKLSFENEYLRKLLHINYSEEVLIQFEREIKEKEIENRILLEEKYKETKLHKFEKGTFKRNMNLFTLKAEINENLDPNWDIDFKDLNEMCEKMLKMKEKNYYNEEFDTNNNFINEFAETEQGLENLEDFNFLTQKLPKKQKFSKFFNDYDEEVDNIEEYVLQNSQEKKKHKIHKKSKTSLDEKEFENTSKIHKTIKNHKKFFVDDTCL